MKIEQTKVIYVIYNPENERIKIGIATNLKSRISSIESSCGCRCELLYNTLPLKDALKYEKECHNRFDTDRHFGEWFNINKEDAISAVKEITQAAELDELTSNYINKEKTILELSQMYGMSRQGIVKRLALSGIYHTKTREDTKGDLPLRGFTKKQKAAKKIKKPNIPEFNINSCTRIAPNTYKHKTTGEVIFAKWIDGRMQILTECN